MLATRRFTALNGAALVVGVLAGFAAIGFRYAINFVENLMFRGDVGATARETNDPIVSPWGYAVVLVPLAGGIAVGVIRHFWPATRQQGIAEVMAAVQAKGGILRGRTSWGHALMSALTVGTGGSTGREGPIAYIGSALGSSLGRRLKFRARDIKVLLGCGFSAGIAATFNTPLGGVVLALELILPEFSTHALIPVVASTVVGVTVAHYFLGDAPTFEVPAFTFTSPWELVIYLILGVACGVAGVGFIRTMSWTGRMWAALRIPETAKPALGGLLVGLIGLALFESFGAYHVFGTGYATVTSILRGDSLALDFLPVLLVLILAKPLATSITIGSGGAGGVFSASLYQGALVGGLVGLVAHELVPTVAVDPVAYALVGMGAVYAATARATLAAIVMLAELTNDYAVVLPLMFAAVTADAVSVAMSDHSIYQVSLDRKGIRYQHDRVQSPLDFLQVKDVMTRTVHTLPSTLAVGEAFNKMIDRGHTGFPVVDDEGRLAGMVTRRDLSRAIQEGKGERPVAEVCSGLAITAYPEDLLHRARDRMFEQEIGRLVIVHSEDRRAIVGILTRTDILAAEARMDVDYEEPRRKTS